MKKELIIVVVIIICIIIASIISQNNTKKEIASMNEQLEMLRLDVIDNKKNYVELTKNIDEIFESWMQKNKTLSLYLEHNELEKVNLSLKMIKGFIEIDIIDESVPEIENCKAILDHIEEKQDFNIKNIF